MTIVTSHNLLGDNNEKYTAVRLYDVRRNDPNQISKFADAVSDEIEPGRLLTFLNTFKNTEHTLKSWIRILRCLILRSLYHT